MTTALTVVTWLLVMTNLWWLSAFISYRSEVRKQVKQLKEEHKK